MFLSKWLSFTAGLASAASLAPRAPTAWSNYVKNGVFYPSQQAESWRTLYARTLQLADKSILLSWEDYDPTVKLTYWPVYRSTDGGASFASYSRVEDQVNGWGNWYQPFLYELPQALGNFPKGTILIAGASTPRNLSAAYIDIYASPDQGKTWKFVSHIVYGAGPETIRNGDKAVWEPFLMMYNGKLVCYYSTQTDPAHAQVRRFHLMQWTWKVWLTFTRNFLTKSPRTCTIGVRKSTTSLSQTIIRDRAWPLWRRAPSRTNTSWCSNTAVLLELVDVQSITRSPIRHSNSAARHRS